MEKRKKKGRRKDASGGFDEAIAARSGRKYVLRLYVAGTTSRSLRAVSNLKKVCQEHLEGRYDLEIVDLYQNPVLASGDQILATPTLIKVLPLPIRKLIGDLSDLERVLVGLDIRRD